LKALGKNQLTIRLLGPLIELHKGWIMKVRCSPLLCNGLIAEEGIISHHVGEKPAILPRIRFFLRETTYRHNSRIRRHIWWSRRDYLLVKDVLVLRHAYKCLIPIDVKTSKSMCGAAHSIFAIGVDFSVVLAR
jgi:hypothetical protein